MFSVENLCRPVMGRCYVPSDLFLNLEPSRSDCLSILQELGLRALHVDPLADIMGQVNRARYALGACQKEAPAVVDCSSFVQWVMARQGISLPRYSGLIRNCGDSVSIHGRQPGDLVFRDSTGYRKANNPLWFGHVGIVIDSVNVAHADQERGTVVVESLADFSRDGRIDSVRSFLRRSGTTYELPPGYELHSASELPYRVSIAYARRSSASV